VPTKPPEPTKVVTNTPAPTATLPPLKCEKMANPPTVAAGQPGSADKPIVIGFVPSGDTGRIARAGNGIADCLNKITGLNFKIEVGTSFAATIEAMGANKAQVGFLNTFSVLLARQKYQIVPALAVLRKYNTNAIDPDKEQAGKLTAYYKGQFIASKASGIKSFADMKGKTFCFVDPNSTSGYIIPNIILKANGINSEKDFKGVQNAGSHDNVGIAVYKGDCDAGVSYIDVLTDAAANLKGKYPDILDKVTYVAVTDKIPNDGVQYVKELDAKVQAAITDGLLAMSADPGGNATLRLLYTIDGFQKIDATFYDEFTGVLKKAGVDPATLVK
jgi:phosphonate transport system substrate-binding protein